MGLHGAHWSVSQKMEVAQAESSTIARRQELHHAQRETHLDNKTKYLTGMDHNPSAEKGKGKTKKGSKDPGGKGKGDRDVKKDGKDRGRGQDAK